MDRAGAHYWDDHWETVAQTDFRPWSGAVRDYRDQQLAKLILSCLPDGGHVIEAGCADSTLLPFLGARGYQISGLDYSEVGCARFRQRLARAGMTAQIECCDLFDPPVQLREAADAALSYGLIEHFTDTHACVSAIANLVRPGGILISIIPNMRGLVGLAQKLCARSVYNIHVPLSVSDLLIAHADMEIIDSGYLLPAGFGVVNFHEPGDGVVLSRLKRVSIALLARASWCTWAIDKHVHLPRSALLSPYAYCIARKP